MKKLLTVLALSSAMVLIFAGCGQKPTIQQPFQGVNQQVQRGQRLNFNTPEFELRRELSSLQRLQRGDSPLSKEQIDKLVPIINDIKSKDTIDKAYADKQVEAINAILTDAQKSILNSRPQRGNNTQQGVQNQSGQQSNNQTGNVQQGNPNGQLGNVPPTNGNGQRGNWNGQKGTGNGQPGGGQQVSLTDECTRVLDLLQKGQ